jgi:HD-GYP domain-containing protein (c-di-GMP phosphodiesterase class II)
VNGSGYPDGLRGARISVLAQIIGVVDAFDAMTTDRPYRSALGLDRAIDELRRDVARGAMSAELVTPFVDLVSASSAKWNTPSAGLDAWRRLAMMAAEPAQPELH